MPFTISWNTPVEWNHYLNYPSHYFNYLQDCVLPAPQYSTQSFVIFSTSHPLQLYPSSGTHFRSIVISQPPPLHFSHSPSLAFQSVKSTPVTSFWIKISEQRENTILNKLCSNTPKAKTYCKGETAKILTCQVYIQHFKYVLTFQISFTFVSFPLLAHATQVNCTFRAHWFVSSGEINEYYLPPCGRLTNCILGQEYF